MILAACSAGPPVAPDASPGDESLTISVEPGDILASVKLEPHAEAVIEATGADGSRYVLELAASSVAAPTTISLRPLTQAEIPGGTLVAGVEIEPSGLHLFFPATLTIIPARDSDASSVVPLEYQGSAAATARLAAMVPGSGLGDHQLMLTHFSGGLLGSVDAATRDALWMEAAQTRRAPNRDTPEGRQAQADLGQRAVDYALETGAISAETAEASRTRWQEQWWEAEADRLSNDPQLKQAIESGNPGDLDTVRTELGKVMEAALRLDQYGEATPASNAARARVTTLATEYARRMVEHLRRDEAFQTKLTAGQVSDLAELQAIFEALVGLARQLALLGVAEDQTTAALREFMRKLALALGASCAQAPILPELAAAFTRQAMLLGEEASADEFAKCLPVACPGGTSLETGIATTSWRADAVPHLEMRDSCEVGSWMGQISGDQPEEEIALTLRPAVSWSMTGLEFRLANVHGNRELYEAVRGEVTTHSELQGGCREDGTGSIPGNLKETEVPQLTIDRSDPDHPTYSLYLNTDVPTTIKCPDDDAYASSAAVSFISDLNLPMTMENGEWIIEGTWSEGAECACGITGLTVRWRFSTDR
jgi:hypothetical protein